MLILLFASLLSALALTHIQSLNLTDMSLVLILDEDGLTFPMFLNGTLRFYDLSGSFLREIKFGGQALYADKCCNRIYVSVVNGSASNVTIIEDGTVKSVPVVTAGWVKGLSDGFLVCNKGCARYDLNGNLLWNTTGIYMGIGDFDGNFIYIPAFRGSTVYIIDVNDGSNTTIEIQGAYLLSASVCKNYLALTGMSNVYLYDLNSKRVLWSKPIGPSFKVSFGPECYLLVPSLGNHSLYIYDVNGNLVKQIDFENPVVSAAWWMSYLAVNEACNALVSFYTGESCEPQGLYHLYAINDFMKLVVNPISLTLDKPSSLDLVLQNQGIVPLEVKVTLPSDYLVVLGDYSFTLPPSSSTTLSLSQAIPATQPMTVTVTIVANYSTSFITLPVSVGLAYEEKAFALFALVALMALLARRIR